MEYRQRQYSRLSACGLSCGLCPRFHTEGTSRCPGCAGEGFSAKHPSCGHLSCAQRHEVEYCAQCGEYPCARFEKAILFDSFISHRNMMEQLDRLRAAGADAVCAELDEKMEALRLLLDSYDDGRRKSFFCVAVNLLGLADVRSVIDCLPEETEGMSAKERATVTARLLQAAADGCGISLKLRKRERDK